ncbi:MAG: hypothetical protein H6559_25920 [Lewinellaceae bacterium]|nr:hypothetical protein [Lewinellaceae bacterium]
MLYSPSADKYYVGQTPELETRLLFHNELSENSFLHGPIGTTTGFWSGQSP